VIIVGGSETTATLLCGLSYLLLKKPETLKILTDEVRSMFKSEDEINLQSVTKLKYMLACIDEALRRYPPTPWGMARVIPQGGATVSGVYVPEQVTIMGSFNIVLLFLSAHIARLIICL